MTVDARTVEYWADDENPDKGKETTIRNRCSNFETPFFTSKIFKSMRSGQEGWAAARAKSLQIKIGKTKAEMTALLTDG